LLSMITFSLIGTEMLIVSRISGNGYGFTHSYAENSIKQDATFFKHWKSCEPQLYTFLHLCFKSSNPLCQLFLILILSIFFLCSFIKAVFKKIFLNVILILIYHTPLGYLVLIRNALEIDIWNWNFFFCWNI